MIKTAVVSLLVLPHFIAYPANKYEKLARINRYRSLGRFIIQNSQQLQLQQSWSIQLRENICRLISDFSELFILNIISI